MERTPLWYYILAEAAVLGKEEGQNQEGGQRLGPLGSTIVAEVLVGLIRRTGSKQKPRAGRGRSLIKLADPRQKSSLNDRPCFVTLCPS